MTIRRADASTRDGLATAPPETARGVALVEGGGMIPTILRRALAIGAKAA